jgi:hypothetical protein
MDVDPLNTVESLNEDQPRADRRSARLNAMVAITVAVLATFMGICKIKDDNIVQAMQQAQADKLDHWNFYQARNIRQEVATATVTQLQLARLGRTGPEAVAYDEAIARYEKIATDQAGKKDELKKLAEQDQKTYDGLNFHDDQFDLSDAALALAIALLAVTALTHQRWLYWLTLVPTAFGVFMGLSGLLGWTFHPDALVRLLT